MLASNARFYMINFGTGGQGITYYIIYGKFFVLFKTGIHVSLPWDFFSTINVFFMFVDFDNLEV